VRCPIPLAQAYRLLNHGPVVLVAAAAGKRRSVMTASWVVPFDVAEVGLVLAAGSYTRALAERSGELTISVPPASMVEVVLGVGSVSGRRGDKLKRFGLRAMPADVVCAPLIEGCLGWLECRLHDDAEIGKRYDLLVADVVAAWADDEVYRRGRWRFTDDTRRTLHHLGGRDFLAAGAPCRVPR
jgi:flavin reductase (DIM6/NTAB) family NADH-FMN oxidoreductase RutF